jgi:hypothetical protein
MDRVSHPRFDSAFFADMFSLARLRDRARELAFLTPSGPIITSPFHLTMVELVRREVLGATVPANATPVDVFVFGAGEPPAPYLIKVGGVPFRSRRKAWPTTSDGRPLGFVGQLCLVDSVDLVPNAPGDVLLIFADAEDRLSIDAYVLEWVRLEEEDPMSKSDMPSVHYTFKPGPLAQKRGAVPEKRSFELFECHGVIHRSFDLPGSAALFSAYEQPYRVAVLEATKIGGAPSSIQASPSIAGDFVAQLASVQPAPEVAYPWNNQESPLSMAARHKIPTWKMGDMGSLYVFDRAGRTVLDVQSY